MAEFRVYVTAPGVFRVTTNMPVPQFDMHLITGPHRTCSDGFWCPRCHPQISLTLLRTPREGTDTYLGLAGR